MFLKEFRKRYYEAILDFLWRYWSKLGVYGQIEEGDDQYVIDPESLLVFSAFFCRYDARLYDLVIDWLRKNGRWMSIQRLKAIAGSFPHCDFSSLGCMAAYVSEEGERRWRKLASDWLPEKTNPVVLFQSVDGNTMDYFSHRDPVAEKYGYLRHIYQPFEKAGVFSPGRKGTLLLQMRGIFGLSARAETVLILLNHDYCKVQDIVEESGYTWKSIQEVLQELKVSGIVEGHEGNKRGSFFSLRSPEEILRLFHQPSALFPNWRQLLNFFQQIWGVISDQRFEQMSERTWHAEIAEILSGQFLDGLPFSSFQHFRKLRSESIEELPEWIDEL